MKRGNLTRAEKVPRADRLLYDQIERKDRCGAGGHRVCQLLETDALAAQFGVGELLLRRRRLARMRDAMRKRGLLCRKQQQHQQTKKDALQFHVVLEGSPGSVARWPENVRTRVMCRIATAQGNRTRKGTSKN